MHGYNWETIIKVGGSRNGDYKPRPFSKREHDVGVGGLNRLMRMRRSFRMDKFKRKRGLLEEV